MNDPARTYEWPSLTVDEWTATRDTLHMWTQIVGKIRMALAPPLPHWWHVALHVSPSGLTTGPVDDGSALVSIEPAPKAGVWDATRGSTPVRRIRDVNFALSAARPRAAWESPRRPSRCARETSAPSREPLWPRPCPGTKK